MGCEEFKALHATTTSRRDDRVARLGFRFGAYLYQRSSSYDDIVRVA